MVTPMTDEERQRAKERAMANNERQRGDDLVKRLRSALTYKDLVLCPKAADRIEELSNCVAVLEAKLARVVEALQAAADDLSGYVGYSYADEYRTTLAELSKEQSGVATVSEAESDEKGQGDE